MKCKICGKETDDMIIKDGECFCSQYCVNFYFHKNSNYNYMCPKCLGYGYIYEEKETTELKQTYNDIDKIGSKIDYVTIKEKKKKECSLCHGKGWTLKAWKPVHDEPGILFTLVEK